MSECLNIEEERTRWLYPSFISIIFHILLRMYINIYSHYTLYTYHLLPLQFSYIQTTILTTLPLGITKTVPTIGFIPQYYIYKNVPFTIYFTSCSSFRSYYVSHPTCKLGCSSSLCHPYLYDSTPTLLTLEWEMRVVSLSVYMVKFNQPP